METIQERVAAQMSSRPSWKAVVQEQGRSLRWLAKQTGMSASTVYDYSRGEYKPSLEWLVVVSELLGVEVTW